jgi:hypothetical protein
MNTTTRERSAQSDDAPNTATDNQPPAEDLVPVLASRNSVIAAIAALRGEAPSDFHRSEGPPPTGADDPAPPQEESAEERKKRYDKKNRQTERQADAKLGIKQCPVKLPTNLHDALRQFARHATDDPRTLLAFATFLLRPELWDLLPTIELRKDNDELLAALQVVFRDEQLVQIVIYLAASVGGSSTPRPEHGRSLITALLRDTALMDACLTVYSDPLLQKTLRRASRKPRVEFARAPSHLATRLVCIFRPSFDTAVFNAGHCRKSFRTRRRGHARLPSGTAKPRRLQRSVPCGAQSRHTRGDADRDTKYPDACSRPRSHARQRFRRLDRKDGGTVSMNATTHKLVRRQTAPQ